MLNLRVVLLLLILCTSHSNAHDIDVTGVARVFLDAYAEQEYRLSIADQQVPPLFDITRILPERCEGLEPGPFAYRFRCQPELNIEDSLVFPWSFEGVVALVTWQDGRESSAYFEGDGVEVVIPLESLQAGAASMRRLAGNYFVLGAEHIAFGIDHLLFVLGLLLLIQKLKPLALTITAFTVAHSITLAAAVLEFFPLAGPPIEALIALSIALLAREVIMGYRGQQTLVHRKPWLVSFVFGLIHGFGFAGALGELGLSSDDIPIALIFFNLGVEFGQLAFIAIVLCIGYSSGRLLGSHNKKLQLATAYCLGGIALFWFAERLPPLLIS